MKTSPVGVALIKRWEGLELEAYQDIAGVWTIGYGHTETAGPNQKISEREAEDLLKRDLAWREEAVLALTLVPLNQNEFDALVSFVFNVGAGAYRKSTARKRLNRGDRIGAAEALTWFNKATVDGVLREVPGLTRRRAAEKALFLEPIDVTPFDESPDDGIVVAPGKTAEAEAPPQIPAEPVVQTRERREGFLTRLRRLLAPRTQRRLARRDPASAAIAGVRHPEAP